ncbi:amino acid permease-domain-containing protein [Dactylonectria macrodidyma]|uniref:Amino acid permease-domain-containing protein n=1 Tax=Dactylonectria macrodidyma TaxID=307937 RepID=A0A9P9DMD5_9HYPO|nr:amino acid permease-domain-containing protein [Dactylonectria macrodidyma]
MLVATGKVNLRNPSAFVAAFAYKHPSLRKADGPNATRSFITENVREVRPIKLAASPPSSARPKSLAWSPRPTEATRQPRHSFLFVDVATLVIRYGYSVIKVLAILAFFICAILITSGAIGGEKIGFKFYHNPSLFADGAKGVFRIFVFAALQYSDTEMIGLTAGESANPSKDVPNAVKSVLWRIVGIFLLGIFFLTITVPYNVGSRTLYGLADEGLAPKIFRWTNKRGVPVYSLIFMNLIGFLSLLNLSSGAGVVYT